MGVEGGRGQGEGRWPSEAAEPGQFRWYHKAGALVFVFFCFELGVVLLLFPWLDLWDQNYFSSFSPGWAALWRNPFVRGAVSGLGLVDIAISISELFRLRRFSRAVRNTVPAAAPQTGSRIP